MAVIAGIKIGKDYMYLKNIQTVVEEGKSVLDKVTVTDKQTEAIQVHCDLASSFGTLDKKGGKKLDNELMLMIASTMRALGKLPDLKWKTVVSCMMQNSLLEPMDTSTVMRSAKLIKKGINVFNPDGSPSQPIVNEVKSWFVRLINDQDVLDDTKIDITVLAKMVASTGALIDSFETLFAKHSYHERTVIDVGVLRFPEAHHPYFKLYRIQLRAWMDCTRFMFVQHDANGITGQFQCMKLKPGKSVMKRLSDRAIAQAVKEALDLFD